LQERVGEKKRVVRKGRQRGNVRKERGEREGEKGRGKVSTGRVGMKDK
jgi:hypothetical protein